MQLLPLLLTKAFCDLPSVPRATRTISVVLMICTGVGITAEAQRGSHGLPPGPMLDGGKPVYAPRPSASTFLNIPEQ